MSPEIETLPLCPEVSHPTPASHARKKILLVDDDPAIRRVLTRLLAEEDYTALPAANGAEALELAAATSFDLVLLDLNMPVKDGWETFQQLAAQNPLLPIIVITARANQLFPALAAGVGALLEKPLDFTRLFLTIHNLLEEPLAVRLARITGHEQEFRYAPPAA
jgi:two-component system response regulator AtoC